jgi:hypothetical protein
MSTTVCVANIGPRERKMRIRVGVIFLGVGVLLAATLLVMSVARPWRIAVFVPLWIGSIGIFQAREKTCVALVAQSARNMDAGVEAVTDPSEIKQLRAQARTVYVQSLILAAIVSAAVIAAP